MSQRTITVCDTCGAEQRTPCVKVRWLLPGWTAPKMTSWDQCVEKDLCSGCWAKVARVLGAEPGSGKPIGSSSKGVLQIQTVGVLPAEGSDVHS